VCKYCTHQNKTVFGGFLEGGNMPSMILENDYMFSGNGIVPWHGIGSVLDGVLTSEDAIKEARLEWMVNQVPIYASNNFAKEIPGYVANVRSDTKEVLGIVSQRYQIAQNKDVFAFADSLIENGKTKCTYETAGSLFNGRRVFMLVNMPERKIMGDEYQPYLCLSNSHDGSSCLNVFLTGIRVVCNNTLSAALHSAKRKVSIRHRSFMNKRKDEAMITIGAASKYFHQLETFASELAGKNVNLGKVLNVLFPISSEMTKRQADYTKEVKEIIQNMNKHKDDLQNFKGTAWGAYSAIVDYRSNAEPKRKTSTWAEKKMERFIDGDPIMNRAQEIIMEMAA
jgi:phage/plasmid-like protein (TIGR03299 family)